MDRTVMIEEEEEILIPDEKGLKNPQCICLKHDESSGFICDYYGRFLVEFNLSYGNIHTEKSYHINYLTFNDF